MNGDFQSKSILSCSLGIGPIKDLDSVNELKDRTCRHAAAGDHFRRLLAEAPKLTGFQPVPKGMGYHEKGAQLIRDSAKLGRSTNAGDVLRQAIREDMAELGS